MSDSKSFWDHPVEKLEEALNIRKQLAALQKRLSDMFSSDEVKPAKATVITAKKGKRTMSPEARAGIAAAARVRWAKVKGTATAAAPKAAKAAKKKGGITPEGRARLAAAMKARWAARAKGAPAPTASTKKAKRNISPEARAKMAEAARRRWAKAKA